MMGRGCYCKCLEIMVLGITNQMILGVNYVLYYLSMPALNPYIQALRHQEQPIYEKKTKYLPRPWGLNPLIKKTMIAQIPDPKIGKESNRVSRA